MGTMKKLPDAEFDIMKIVWSNEPPVTTPEIMRQLGADKEWKIQTVVTFMCRLTERGFLRSEKLGKERSYYPLVSKDEYLRFETDNFMKQFHNNLFLDLVNTLYDGDALTDEDIDDLLKWAKERRG